MLMDADTKPFIFQRTASLDRKTRKEETPLAEDNVSVYHMTRLCIGQYNVGHLQHTFTHSNIPPIV